MGELWLCRPLTLVDGVGRTQGRHPMVIDATSRVQRLLSTHAADAHEVLGIRTRRLGRRLLGRRGMRGLIGSDRRMAIEATSSVERLLSTHAADAHEIPGVRTRRLGRYLL